VYLKSLTLRGFKSFASATSLRLEQGITCVVGPKGSGKGTYLAMIAARMTTGHYDGVVRNVL